LRENNVCDILIHMKLAEQLRTMNLSAQLAALKGAEASLKEDKRAVDVRGDDLRAAQRDVVQRSRQLHPLVEMLEADYVRRHGYEVSDPYRTFADRVLDIVDAAGGDVELSKAVTRAVLDIRPGSLPSDS